MTSTLKHDSAGFLVGDLLDVNRELLDGQSAGMAVWRGIRSDVKAIARALGVQVRTSGSSAKSQLRATSQSGRSASGPERDASGRFVRQVATPAGRTGSSSSGSTSAQRTATSAAERMQSNARTTTVTTANRSRGQSLGRSATPDAADTRDSMGRFIGGSKGGSGGGASDKRERDTMGMLTSAIGKLGDSIEGADQLDPTIAAMREVKEAISPVGRGFKSLLGRNPESKKEAWYARFLKALTSKKEGTGSAVGAGGKEESGGFLQTLMSSGLTAAFVPVIAAIGAGLLAIAPVLAAALAVAFVAWMAKKALESETGKKAVADFGKGMTEQAQGPVKYAPFGSTAEQVLDASGRNLNDPRRLDRKDAVGTDGRAINDPRRLDLQESVSDIPDPVIDGQAPLKVVTVKRNRLGRIVKDPSLVPTPGAELPPATSIAQSAGRFAGGISKLLGVNGTKRTYENNDGSTEERSGGTVSWRNNNPGNLKLEYAGSDDPTVKTKRTKAQALAEAKKRYEGVVDLDQFGNAIFSTEEAGRTAQAKLLTQTHGRKTIEEMLPKYAIDDVSGKANHKAYANGIYKTADSQGVDLRSKKIGDLNPQEMNALLDGMKKVKGFKVGTISTMGTPASSPTIAVGVARIPSVSIPSSVPERIAPMSDAAIPTQLNNAKQVPVNVSMREPIGQDVGDRSIAHVVSGGLGHIA